MTGEKNRRLLDMLAGWQRYVEESSIIYPAVWNSHEQEAIADLYQEARQIADDDGKGIAHFIFNRVLYMILDGEPR